MPQTVKGEIESWGREPNYFGEGKRGSLGMKVENKWHNLIGNVDKLLETKRDFPVGSIVEFQEEQNKRGYWDILEGTLKLISKKEAYSEKITAPKEEDFYWIECFRAAVLIQLEDLKFNIENKDFKLDRDVVAIQIAEQTKKIHRELMKAKEAKE